YGNGAKCTPAISGANPDRNFVPLVVIDAAATVRPWKPPWNAMMFGLPVAWRASRSDASTASEPELTKNSESRPSGNTSPSRSDSVSSGWCITVVYCAWMTLPICSCAAATTFGWQWPVLVTPIPEVKSRWRLPSVSYRYTPSPWSTTTGVACLSSGESWDTKVLLVRIGDRVRAGLSALVDCRQCP